MDAIAGSNPFIDTPPASAASRRATPSAPSWWGETAAPAVAAPLSFRAPAPQRTFELSAASIGRHDNRSDKVRRMETDNKTAYRSAANESLTAGHVTISNASTYRHRFPHTLGRIKAYTCERDDERQMSATTMPTRDNPLW
jgi:hypothetical protein